MSATLKEIEELLNGSSEAHHEGKHNVAFVLLHSAASKLLENAKEHEDSIYRVSNDLGQHLNS